MTRLTRRGTLAALGGGLAMPWVRPSWAQGGQVNVYNWADYIGETTLEDFENETGISVVYDMYSSSEEMQAKMLAGMTGYDVTLMAGQSMPEFIRAGLFQKIDRARLTGWENLNPTLLTILDGWDPGAQHSVPYMWGSVGFTFNVDMVRERIPDADFSDLGLVFDPENAAKLADCGISILDSPKDVMPQVARWLGLDGNMQNTDDYQKIVDAFAAIRPYIRTFDNVNYLNALPNKEVCVVNNWSGDYGAATSRAREAGVDLNLVYEVPVTGAPIWFDVWTLPVDAPNLDNAYAFLNFMLRPEVVAACTNFTWYANVNDASRRFVDPALLADPAVYPSDDIIRRMWAPLPFTEEMDRAVMRAWAEVKAG
jgi:putrescine transport system substrate-binding protein